MKSRSGRVALDCALLLALTLGTMYLAVWATLAAHLPSTRLTLTAAFALLAALLWVGLSRLGVRVCRPAILLAVMLCLGSVAGAVFVYDSSFDGQIYHQDAVVQLHAGWNPFYDPAAPSSPWVRHYPKAPWMIAAFLYEFIPRIEVGKAANAIAFFASLFASFALL